MSIQQDWALSETGEIRRKESCFDYSNGANIILYDCHGSMGNQQWEYLEVCVH